MGTGLYHWGHFVPQELTEVAQPIQSEGRMSQTARLKYRPTLHTAGLPLVMPDLSAQGFLNGLVQGCRMVTGTDSSPTLTNVPQDS